MTYAQLLIAVACGISFHQGTENWSQYLWWKKNSSSVTITSTDPTFSIAAFSHSYAVGAVWYLVLAFTMLAYLLNEVKR